MFLWPTSVFVAEHTNPSLRAGLFAAVARRWPWGAVERVAASVSAMAPGCGRATSH
jgi:hypothetical protein